MFCRFPVLTPALVALALCAVTPGLSLATDVTVENYGNSDISVCFAFNKGRTVSDGWHVIKPNEKKVFKNDTQDDMYLRVEMNRKELDFSNFRQFLTFPTIESRFVVRSEPDDPTIRTYKWGTNLEFSTNRTRDEALPNGWAHKRYFKIRVGGRYGWK